jgi:hypothetical protein
MSGPGAWLENDVIGADWPRAGAGVDFFAARRWKNTPSERGIGLVGSWDCLKDLGADIRRTYVHDPAYRYVSPLAAGHPLDAREREQKARIQ